jgi:hypothetical protein
MVTAGTVIAAAVRYNGGAPRRLGCRIKPFERARSGDSTSRRTVHKSGKSRSQSPFFIRG